LVQRTSARWLTAVLWSGAGATTLATATTAATNALSGLT
jgi:hypothetical protein